MLFIPLTVTVYNPVVVVDGIEIVSFDVADGGETVTGLGWKLNVGPAGDEDAERLMAPMKLLMLETVTVVLALAPWAIERLDGLGDKEKSWTCGFCTRNTPCMAG